MGYVLQLKKEHKIIHYYYYYYYYVPIMFALLFVLRLSCNESRTGGSCVGPLWLKFHTNMFSNYLILGAGE